MHRRHSVLVAALAGSAIAGVLFAGCGDNGGGGGLGFINPPPPTSTGPCGFEGDCIGPTTTQVGPRPTFGPTVTQEKTPPPISGGTLIVAKDGVTAVAADPDRDQVYVVNLTTRAVQTIALQPGDEPGRVVEDGHQRAHVALRSGGAVATIDLASGTLLGRRSVCVAPRGIAYDAADDSLYVACASGEVAQMASAADGPTLRVARFDRDLRDVVIDGGNLYVSKFRSAHVLVLQKSTLTSVAERQPPSSAEGSDPAAAWRMLPAPGGGFAMVHQRARGSEAPPVSTQPGGYGGGGGGGCEAGIVESAVTSFSRTGVMSTGALSAAVLPVDFAISSNGQVAVIAAGNGHTPALQQVMLFDGFNSAVPPPPPLPEDAGAGDAGAIPPDPGGPPPGGCEFSLTVPQPKGQAIAVAFDGNGFPVVQLREPAALFIPTFSTTIKLSSDSREDTGHAIFHSNAGAFVACASCHLEGQDDAHVWNFDSVGPRRTPALRGTVEGTAPYHWAGEEHDFPMLVHDVFMGRMGGPSLELDQQATLSRYVNKLPALPAPPPVDQAAVDRGRTLFEGSAGCSGCHNGAKLTNNLTVDVGTGGTFQVPSLVGVAYRAPFLHMGCAGTLAERFQCGGGQHGNTKGLTPGDIDDLVAFLGTL